VSEYLTEEEQVERLKQWWKENGRSIIAGVVIGLGIFGGWQGWQIYETRKAEQGAATYDSFVQQARAEDAAATLNAAESLRDKFGQSAYADFAAMEAARQLAGEGRLDEAAAQLRTVHQSGSDAAIREIARLRLARILLAQDNLDETEALLAAPAPQAFAGELALLKGDLARARGQLDQARAEYQQARSLGAGDSQWLDLILEDLGGGAAG